MSIITQADVNRIIEVDPYSQKLISLISILESYLNLVSEDHLASVGKGNLSEITLKDLGILYNTFLNINSGVHGVCWEYAVFNAIYYNDTYVQDLINTAINYLSGERSYERLNAILWGGEKNNISSENIKSNLNDSEVIWTLHARYKFKNYVDLILKSFHSDELKKALPKEIKGIWKADLFVKKENSNVWYAITVKWNKSEVKSYPGLSIGIHFENIKSAKKLENPKMAKNDFVYCCIPFSYNLGTHFAEMFRFIKTTLSEINLKQKNTLWLKFPTDLEKSLFDDLYNLRDVPCINIIMYLKNKYMCNTCAYENSETILATDRTITFTKTEIKELKQTNVMITVPNRLYV